MESGIQSIDQLPSATRVSMGKILATRSEWRHVLNHFSAEGQDLSEDFLKSKVNATDHTPATLCIKFMEILAEQQITLQEFYQSLEKQGLKATIDKFKAMVAQINNKPPTHLTTVCETVNPCYKYWIIIAVNLIAILVYFAFLLFHDNRLATFAWSYVALLLCTVSILYRGFCSPTFNPLMPDISPIQTNFLDRIRFTPFIGLTIAVVRLTHVTGVTKADGMLIFCITILMIAFEAILRPETPYEFRMIEVSKAFETVACYFLVRQVTSRIDSKQHRAMYLLFGDIVLVIAHLQASISTEMGAQNSSFVIITMVGLIFSPFAFYLVKEKVTRFQMVGYVIIVSYFISASLGWSFLSWRYFADVVRTVFPVTLDIACWYASLLLTLDEHVSAFPQLADLVSSDLDVNSMETKDASTIFSLLDEETE